MAEKCPPQRERESALDALWRNHHFGAGWIWPYSGIAEGSPAKHPAEWRWHYFDDAYLGQKSLCGKWTYDPESDHAPEAEPALGDAPLVCKTCENLLRRRGTP